MCTGAIIRWPSGGNKLCSETVGFLASRFLVKSSRSQRGRSTEELLIVIDKERKENRHGTIEALLKVAKLALKE